MAEDLVIGCDQDHELYVFEFDEAKKENRKFPTPTTSTAVSGEEREERRVESGRRSEFAPLSSSSSSGATARSSVTGSNSEAGNNYRFPKRNRVLSHESQTFLDRFRSQASTKSLNFSPSSGGGSSSSSTTNNITTGRAARSFSVKRNPSDSSGEFNSSVHGKPRKWYSFTNLLTKQSIVNILSYPRSRLSVSSTLNSVFIGSGSPPGGSPTLNDDDYGTGIFFSGSRSNYANEDELVGGGGGGGGGGGCESNPDSHDGICLSPTPSCVTISGEFPSRSNAYDPSVVDSFYGRNEHYLSGNDNNGLYNSSTEEQPGRDRTGTYFLDNKSRRSSSTTATTTTARSSTSPLPDTLRGLSFKRLPSASANSKTNNSRLSCGEFFPATSSVPVVHGAPADPSGIAGGSAACPKNSRTNGGVRKALGRSLPTLLQAMESANSGGQTGWNAGSKPVTTQDVFDLLYQEFAILTGAKSLDDRYIMIFPDRGNFHLLADDDYRRLMIYLTSVPPMQESESGFVLVVDRRNDKWASVKTTLLRISSFFPGLIHRVLVLRPVGFLQKAISEVSTKLFRTENLRFHLTICNNVSDLLIFIDSSQLTEDFGGLIVYDKVKWVQQRIEVEAFGAALQVLSKDLKRFTDSFHDFEHPNDVVSTEQLIEAKTKECTRLMDELSLASDHGEALLGRIKSGNYSSSTNGVTNGSSSSRQSNSNSVQLINVISVERFILQIDDTSRLFQEFWAKENAKLEQCLKLRRFEQDFKELQGTFDVNLKSLNSIPDMGDSIAGTDAIMADTAHFQKSTVDDVNRAIELEMVGRVIVSENPSAVDTVEPKCVELKRMATHFGFVLDEKIQTQKDWRHVQVTVERANKLCVEGMELLSSQPSDGTDSTIDPAIMLKKIDAFLEIVKSISDELATSNSLSTATTSQSRNLLLQVHKRVEELQELLCKKRSSLVVQLNKIKFRRNSGSNSTSINTPATLGVYPTPELKAARSTSQLDETGKADLRRDSSSLKSASSSLSLDEGFHAPVLTNANGKKAEENSEAKRIKRGHVLKEMLQTEQTYVKEIGDVLTGYRNGAVDPDTKPLLPKQLRKNYDEDDLSITSEAKMSVLFGNLDEIHQFHSKKFLPDLSNCIENMELVGLCFIQRHTDFLTLYSRYCQLLPASESLRKEIGENHPWFVACRQRLNHKLPLGAYLLKPVQRITKYQLLLKDLLKHSEGCEGYAVLLDALDHMLVILRCVDDGMLQLSIVGYPGKLQDEGPLLLQGSFLLWTENKKDRLRLKGHPRHLFLYQKSILICKKDKDPKSASLYFKTKINLSEIGLTEVLRGSGSSKKFEIWIQGRQKVFILQAESVDSKDMWVQSIKKLLMEQLESLRVTKSISGIGVSSNAASKRHRMMAHNKGVTLNGWRTSASSHRPLRQTSSWVGSDSRPRSRASGEGEGDDEVSSDMSHSDDDETFSLSEPPLTVTTSQPVYPLNTQPNSSYGVGESIENGPKYLALADYNAMGPAEISFREGDILILRKTGCAGWWFVSFPSEKGDSIEGWAPSSFLERLESTTGASSASITDGGSSSLKHTLSQSLSFGSAAPGTAKINESTDDIISALR